MQSLALSDAKREGLKQGAEQGKAYTCRKQLKPSA